MSASVSMEGLLPAVGAGTGVEVEPRRLLLPSNMAPMVSYSARTSLTGAGWAWGAGFFGFLGLLPRRMLKPSFIAISCSSRVIVLGPGAGVAAGELLDADCGAGVGVGNSGRWPTDECNPERPTAMVPGRTISSERLPKFHP